MVRKVSGRELTGLVVACGLTGAALYDFRKEAEMVGKNVRHDS